MIRTLSQTIDNSCLWNAFKMKYCLHTKKSLLRLPNLHHKLKHWINTLTNLNMLCNFLLADAKTLFYTSRNICIPLTDIGNKVAQVWTVR